MKRAEPSLLTLRFKARSGTETRSTKMRRVLHGFVAGLVASALIVGDLARVAGSGPVPCRITGGGAIVNEGYLDSQNIRHLTITVPSSWENTPYGTQFANAIGDWNNREETTGVHLELSYTSDGKGGNVEVGLLGSSYPSCAGYAPETDALNFHPELLSATSTYPDQVRHVMTHELGHVLGLGHTTDESSVMHAPSYPACSLNTVGSFATGGVQEDDAISGGDCARNMTESVPNQGTSEWYQNQEECWELWYFYFLFQWNGESWELIDSYSVYQYTTCYPPA
jgi:metallopeptidase family M12-like protein